MRNSLMLAAAVLAACGTGPEPSADSRDARLLKDRVWVDHVPRHERDTIQLFLVLSKPPPRGPRTPIGVFEAISVWQGRFEAFRYESHGDELRMLFPQTNIREKATVKATRCNVEQYDYCLDIEGSDHGVKRYYSRKGWEAGSLDEATALELREGLR